MMESLNGVLTLLLLILFVGIWIWAWSSKNKAKFDQMARLPLEESSQELEGQSDEQ
jgi:cytochrome c oxidase cbb3-type subunit 4